jgi:hypothetical protein
LDPINNNMGEVVMSGEKIVRVEEEEEKVREEEGSGTESRGGGEMKGLMRWEKFLPKMVLRVLLVEADDCTRQIITALLRKCNYKGTICIIIIFSLISLFLFCNIAVCLIGYSIFCVILLCV